MHQPLSEEQVRDLEEEIDDYILFQPALNELNPPLLIHRIETGVWNSRLESAVLNDEDSTQEHTATGKLIRAYDWVVRFRPRLISPRIQRFQTLGDFLALVSNYVEYVMPMFTAYHQGFGRMHRHSGSRKIIFEIPSTFFQTYRSAESFRQIQERPSDKQLESELFDAYKSNPAYLPQELVAAYTSLLGDGEVWPVIPHPGIDMSTYKKAFYAFECWNWMWSLNFDYLEDCSRLGVFLEHQGFAPSARPLDLRVLLSYSTDITYDEAEVIVRDWTWQEDPSNRALATETKPLQNVRGRLHWLPSQIWSIQPEREFYVLYGDPGEASLIHKLRILLESDAYRDLPLVFDLSQVGSEKLQVDAIVLSKQRDLCLLIELKNKRLPRSMSDFFQTDEAIGHGVKQVRGWQSFIASNKTKFLEKLNGKLRSQKLQELDVPPDFVGMVVTSGSLGTGRHNEAADVLIASIQILAKFMEQEHGDLHKVVERLRRKEHLVAEAPEIKPFSFGSWTFEWRNV